MQKLRREDPAQYRRVRLGYRIAVAVIAAFLLGLLIVVAVSLITRL